MTIETFDLPGLVLIKPQVFEDERGYFLESFNLNKFEELLGFAPQFVQDNESMSGKDVLRGLHFQAPPYEQAKLIRVVQGAVTDVCVDIRAKSPTYGQHLKIELSAKNKHMLFIPAGFAHGFVTRQDETIFAYKCTGFYNKASECAIHWNDPDLGIEWNVEDPVVSDKDKRAPLFRNLKSTF